MGMEAVEFVLAAEETFGVEIPNADAARMRTARDVVEFLAARVPVRPAARCGTQATFYRLRRGFRAVLAEPPAITPGTRLRALATRETWPVQWTRLRTAAGTCHWPREVRWSSERWSAQTVGGLAYVIARHELRRRPSRHWMDGIPRPASGAWTRDELSAAVAALVYEVSLQEEFRLRHRFVGDLGFH